MVEVQRGDLVGQFLGSTEQKTANKIEEAKRGILFVHEAHRLTPRSSGIDYGRIAINQLMAAMEKGDLVMIFAGYPAEMKDFLNSNPELKSRININLISPTIPSANWPLFLRTEPQIVDSVSVARRAWSKSLNKKQRYRFAASRMEGWPRILWQRRL